MGFGGAPYPYRLLQLSRSPWGRWENGRGRHLQKRGRKGKEIRGGKRSGSMKDAGRRYPEDFLVPSCYRRKRDEGVFFFSLQDGDFFFFLCRIL
jgi:hypothetical protein